MKAIGDETCPEVEKTESGEYLTANGCTDHFGIKWLGEAEKTVVDGDESFNYYGFGVEMPDIMFLMDGFMSWESSDTADVYIIQSMNIDYGDTTDSYILWQDVAADLMWNDGAPKLTYVDGTVGFEDWGTAKLANDEELYLGRARNCRYPAGGTASLTGENTATFNLAEFDSEECGGCPTWALNGDEQGELCDPLPELLVEAAEL